MSVSLYTPNLLFERAAIIEKELLTTLSHKQHRTYVSCVLYTTFQPLLSLPSTYSVILLFRKKERKYTIHCVVITITLII